MRLEGRLTSAAGRRPAAKAAGVTAASASSAASRCEVATGDGEGAARRMRRRSSSPDNAGVARQGRAPRDRAVRPAIASKGRGEVGHVTRERLRRGRTTTRAGRRPARDTRPNVGLSPNTPQSAAGTRIEPFGVGAEREGHEAPGHAAAEPPNEPPAIRDGVARVARRGRVVRIFRREAVRVFVHVERAPIQHRARRAKSLRPRWRHARRAVGGVDLRSGPSVASPATSEEVLAANGTPASGPGSSPAARRRRWCRVGQGALAQHGR